MSEVTIESLQGELKQAKDHIKGLVAQLDATKGMLNEQLASSLQLRTNLQIYGQANHEHIQNEARLNNMVNELIKKVNELTPQPVEGDSNAPSP